VQQMCNNVECNDCNTETTIDMESSDHVPLSSEKNKKFVNDKVKMMEILKNNENTHI